LADAPKNLPLFRALLNEALRKVEEVFPFFPDFFPIVQMTDAEGEHPLRNKLAT
jgi:hypothetical protein